MSQTGQNPFVPGVIQDTFIPDQLVSGPLQLVTDTVTVASGAGELQRGTVLGKVTASGEYTRCVKTATDGSEVPSAILVDYTNAKSSAARVGIYLLGEFNQNRVIFDSSWTLADLAVALRPYSIFLRDSLTASNT